MKYIEEISFGDCFIYNNIKYILTTDFKNNGKRMSISLVDGSIKWIESNEIVDIIDIFTFDKDSNIIAIKERKKEDNVINQN
jgi:hypothetical protein